MENKKVDWISFKIQRGFFKMIVLGSKTFEIRKPNISSKVMKGDNCVIRWLDIRGNVIGKSQANFSRIMRKDQIIGFIKNQEELSEQQKLEHLEFYYHYFKTFDSDLIWLFTIQDTKEVR